MPCGDPNPAVCAIARRLAQRPNLYLEASINSRNTSKTIKFSIKVNLHIKNKVPYFYKKKDIIIICKNGFEPILI